MLRAVYQPSSRFPGWRSADLSEQYPPAFEGRLRVPSRFAASHLGPTGVMLIGFGLPEAPRVVVCLVETLP